MSGSAPSIPPDEKVLIDDTGNAIAVRIIESIHVREGKVWAGFRDGTSDVVLDTGGGHGDYAAIANRDRIIREIWDSPVRVVHAFSLEDRAVVAGVSGVGGE